MNDEFQQVANEESKAGSAQDVQDLIRSCFDYLHNLDEEQILNDVKAIESLSVISEDLFKSNRILIAESSMKSDFLATLIKLIELLRIRLTSSFARLKNESSENLQQTSSETNLAFKLINLLRNLTNYSNSFCKFFHQLDSGIRVLIDYLNDEILLNCYISTEKSNPIVFKALHSLMRGCLGTVLNLTKVYDQFQEKWKKCNAVEVLLRYAEKLKEIKDNQIAAYITLASIADDEEIDQFPDLKLVIPQIAKLIKSCTKYLAQNSSKEPKRLQIQLEENGKIVNVCSVNKSGTLWHLVELLNAIYHMAVSDKIKYDIYVTHKMCDEIKTIVLIGNQTEATFALKLLYQLCFDNRILNLVQSDSTLLSQIKKFANLNENENEAQLTRNSKGIVWLIERNNKRVFEISDELEGENDEYEMLADLKHPGRPRKYEKKKNSNEGIKAPMSERKSKQIMISYNRNSRELCLSIKKELEKLGLNIWIDVEDIHGSSLESMAKAIEDSFCVLMCISENYKQSANCRAEAEYAFQLNKPIIPLIMQENYKADGWLGIIMGSRIFVNFKKYEFEECIRRLKAELANIDKSFSFDKDTNKVEKPDPLLSKPDKAKISALEWSEEQVEKWFQLNNFHQSIRTNILPCNGKLLNKMLDIKKEVPEFFFSTLMNGSSGSANSKGGRPALRDVAKFVYELELLFQQK
jgi:hypothetical protein